MITLTEAAILLIVTGCIHILFGAARLFYLARINILPTTIILIGAALLYLGLMLLEKIR